MEEHAKPGNGCLLPAEVADITKHEKEEFSQLDKRNQRALFLAAQKRREPMRKKTSCQNMQGSIVISWVPVV